MCKKEGLSDKDITIDIGANTKEEAMKVVALGDTVTYDTDHIDYEQINADRLIEGIAESLHDRLKYSREQIEMLKDLIEASNPKSILRRGYSVVTDSEGNIITGTDKLKEGSKVSIETYDGSARAEITEILSGGKYGGR